MESPAVAEGPGDAPFAGRSTSPLGTLDVAVVAATGDSHGPVSALFLGTPATRGDESCPHACD